VTIITVFVAVLWSGDLAVKVLFNESYPDSPWRFLLGLVRWEACLLAYLGSLVDRYPPFSPNTGSVSAAAPLAA